MRNLKKILAITLVVALVFSLNIAAFARDIGADVFSDGSKVDAKFKDATSFLVELDVITGSVVNGEVVLAPTESFTRAELAYITAKIVSGGNPDSFKGYADIYANSGSAMFIDFYKGDWFADAVYYLANMGIVTGDNSRAFNPTGLVTPIEAAAYALCMMGYDKSASGYLGSVWSINVMKDATEQRLFDGGVSAAASTTIQRQEIFQMYMNALSRDAVVYNPGTGMYTKPLADNGFDNKTVVEYRYSQYVRIRGVLVANGYASIADRSGANLTIKKENNRVYIIDTNYGSAAGSNNPYNITDKTYIIDNVANGAVMDYQAPVELLGRFVYGFAKKYSTPYGDRFDGLLGALIPSDQGYDWSDVGDNKGAYNYAQGSNYGPNSGAYDNDASYSYGHNSQFTLNYSNVASLSAYNWTPTAGDNGPNTMTEAYKLRQTSRTLNSYYNGLIWTLAIVTTAGDDMVMKSFNGDTGDTEYKGKATSFENGTALEVGDVVMLLMQGNTIVAAQKCQLVEGALTRTTTSAQGTGAAGTFIDRGWVAYIDGKDYQISDNLINNKANAQAIYTTLATNAEKRFNNNHKYWIWTDHFGAGKTWLVATESNPSNNPIKAIILDAQSAGLGDNALVRLFTEKNETFLAYVDTLNKGMTQNETLTGEKIKVGKEYTPQGQGELLALSNIFSRKNDPKDNHLEMLVIYDYWVVDGKEKNGNPYVILQEYDNTNFKYNQDIRYDGDSAIKNASGITVGTLTKDTLTFATDGTRFYAFKGFTPMRSTSIYGDSSYSRNTNDNSIKSGFLNYNADKIVRHGEYGVIKSSIINFEGNDEGGKPIYSFEMYVFNDNAKRTFKVKQGQWEQQEDFMNAYGSQIEEGRIINFERGEAADEIKSFFFVNPEKTTLTAGNTYNNEFGQYYSGWYEMYITGRGSGGFFMVTGMDGSNIVQQSMLGFWDNPILGEFNLSGTIVDWKNNKTDRTIELGSIWGAVTAWAGEHPGMPVKSGIRAGYKTGTAAAGDVKAFLARVYLNFDENDHNRPSAQYIVLDGSKSYNGTKVSYGANVGNSSSTTGGLLKGIWGANEYLSWTDGMGNPDSAMGQPIGNLDVSTGVLKIGGVSVSAPAATIDFINAAKGTTGLIYLDSGYNVTGAALDGILNVTKDMNLSRFTDNSNFFINGTIDITNKAELTLEGLGCKVSDLVGAIHVIDGTLLAAETNLGNVRIIVDAGEADLTDTTGNGAQIIIGGGDVTLSGARLTNSDVRVNANVTVTFGAGNIYSSAIIGKLVFGEKATSPTIDGMVTVTNAFINGGGAAGANTYTNVQGATSTTGIQRIVETIADSSENPTNKIVLVINGPEGALFKGDPITATVTSAGVELPAASISSIAVNGKFESIEIVLTDAIDVKTPVTVKLAADSFDLRKADELVTRDNITMALIP